jgi:hypothetical protein
MYRRRSNIQNNKKQRIRKIENKHTNIKNNKINIKIILKNITGVYRK